MFKQWKPDPDPKLTDIIQEAFLKAIILGMRHAARKTDFADDPEIRELKGPLTFEEAIAFGDGRIALTPGQFYKLSDAARLHAFTIGRLTQLDMVERAKAVYLKNLSSGESSSYDFLKQMLKDNPVLADKAGIGAYFNMVYRTNMQKDYMAGRMLQLESDPPQFLEFIGIEDGRQTEICASCSGIILPFTDPFWDTHTPPLHFGCRSTVRAIYHEEAEAMGLKAKDVLSSAREYTAKAKPAQKGFGSNPVKNNQTFGLSASQISRVGQYMVQDELNDMAGQTVCRDFSEPKKGYSYEEGLKRGAVRVPEEGLSPDELKNVSAARTLAEDKGFFIELNATPVRGKTQAGNSYFDAWINATEKLDFKIITSSNSNTISDNIYKAALQGNSICLVLQDSGQFASVARAMSSRCLALKAEGRSLTRAFVVYKNKVAEFSWKDLTTAKWEDVVEALTALKK